MKRRPPTPTRRPRALLAAGLALFAVALLLAPAASAERGVAGFFQFSTDNGQPGGFSSAQSIAVSPTGAGGGASPGDLFVGPSGLGTQQFNTAGAFVRSFGSGLSNVTDLALDQTTGDAYMTGSNRINRFSPTGAFLRAWGYDVVLSGPGDSSVDAVQLLTVKAAGGAFTLQHPSFGNPPTTDPLPYDATAQQVEDALNALAAIGGAGGSVSVTDAFSDPGPPLETHAYLIAFGGDFSGDVVSSLGASATNLTGAGKAATVDVVEPGGAPETCVPADGDVCKQGSSGGNVTDQRGAEFDDGFGSLAIAPPGAPNAGNVVLASGRNNRVLEFTPDGDFVRTFAGVLSSGAAGTGDLTAGSPIVANAATAEREFRVGQTITGTGIPAGTQITSIGATRIVLDQPATASGAGVALSVATAPGNVPVNERQTLTLGAEFGGGNFKLRFTAPGPQAVANPQTTADIPFNASAADVQIALEALTNVGAGNVLVASPNPGGGSSPGGPYTVEFTGARYADTDVSQMSTDGSGLIRPQTVSVGASGGTPSGGTFTLTFSGQTTGPIAFDASAAAVRTALESLPNIGAGNVAVSGSAGGPWTVTFTGSLAGAPQPMMSGDPSGLRGVFPNVNVNAPNPVVARAHDGGAGFEVCTAAEQVHCVGARGGTAIGQFGGNNSLRSLAADTTGAIYTQEGGSSSQQAFRVQKFTPAGGLDLTPSLFGSDEEQQVTVNASAGQFRLTAREPEGTVGQYSTAGGANPPGSTVLTGVTTNSGAFVAGEAIEGPRIQPGTHIVAVNGSTLTISRPTRPSNSEGITSTALHTTPDLPHNATAGQVEDALDALAPIADFGSVSVSGGPGGNTPYTVSFDGGRLVHTDAPELIASQGTTPLSGGSGAGADTASVVTTVAGGPGGQGPTTPRKTGSSPLSVAVGAADQVFVARNYPVGADICSDGISSASETRVLELSPAGAVAEVSRPCTGLATGGFNGNVDLAADPASGLPYLLTDGADSLDPAFVYVLDDPGGPPALNLNPISNLEATSATVSGTINHNGGGGPQPFPTPTSTSYRVEFKKSAEADWQVYAPDVEAATGASDTPFNTGISALTPNTSYDARVIVTKPFGFPTLVGATQTFTTERAAPEITSFISSEVSASSAKLNATINPLGTATSYHFEYGTSPAYGQSTPEVDIGDSQSPVSVTQQITGLDPVVHHFRVVARNAIGTTTSANQTFNFYPEPCPNAAARQQTGSGSLPDCRAYELVSPADAGGVSVVPGGSNSPQATNPARFAYGAQFGVLPGGDWNPGALLSDHYVATRTATGWQTAYVGIDAKEAFAYGGPPPVGGDISKPGIRHTASLDRFLVWDVGTTAGERIFAGGFGDRLGSLAPYVFSAAGEKLERLPSNAAGVPGSLDDMRDGGYDGDVETSADFGHYIFSADNTDFAPPSGLTAPPGSAYDNDLAAGTVEIISKTENGDDITETGDPQNTFLNIPGVSPGGSRILIGTPSSQSKLPQDSCRGSAIPCGPTHLYLRDTDEGITYDVSRDRLVNYQGMTEDARTVYFTSAEQVTLDDNDTSVDLYRWEQAGDTLTRVSAGSGGVGDIDGCLASWIAKCGVEVVSVDGGRPSYQKHSDDNAVASESGDVYFYSPEQFVGANGIPGRRNLYVSRGGQIHYVATLGDEDPATRIAVSPDGEHAGIVTASRLTAYDNSAPGDECNVPGEPPRSRCAEMYSYAPNDADPAGGDLRCVSCLPGGEAPTDNVDASISGRFMADDGRLFFSTEDPLVARDTNGLNDVYEFTGGRAQLISSGVAPKDDTGGFGIQAGLLGVSADGVNAYFSTFEPLVAEDVNNTQLRIYDARTNGGFVRPAPQIPCAAADECHGDTASAPAPTRGGTDADLGEGGDVASAAERCATTARAARRLSRHARALRARAGRLARSAEQSRVARRRAASLRRRARRLSTRARRSAARAKRCRAAAQRRRAQSNRRSSR